MNLVYLVGFLFGAIAEALRPQPVRSWLDLGSLVDVRIPHSGIKVAQEASVIIRYTTPDGVHEQILPGGWSDSDPA